jgi:antitoxin component HigA of HigAB toxin-antitoxin module
MSASSARAANTTRSTRRPSEARPAAPIRPIRSAADHRAALAEIERLMHARKGTPEGDRKKGLTRRDLEAAIGSRARVAEILNKRVR